MAVQAVAVDDDRLQLEKHELEEEEEEEEGGESKKRKKDEKGERRERKKIDSAIAPWCKDSQVSFREGCTSPKL